MLQCEYLCLKKVKYCSIVLEVVVILQILTVNKSLQVVTRFNQKYKVFEPANLNNLFTVCCRRLKPSGYDLIH